MNDFWKKFKMPIIAFTAVIIFIFLIIFIYWKWTVNSGMKLVDAGQFGDQFGFLSCIFSGLGVAGLIATLVYQYEERKLQTKQWEHQLFETTFFNLLQNQREIANEINLKLYFYSNFQMNGFDVSGKLFFKKSKSIIEEIKQALDEAKTVEYDKAEFEKTIDEYDRYFSDQDFMYQEFEEKETKARNDINNKYKNPIILEFYKIDNHKLEEYKSKSDVYKLKQAYIHFYDKYGYEFGNYFQHLFHILKLVDYHFLKNDKSDDDEIKEAKKYTNILQAQTTIPELLLLYYNCFNYPEMKALVAKFDFLDSLSINHLIKPDHHVLKEIKLFEDKNPSI
jgi:hypothetical protein